MTTPEQPSAPAARDEAEAEAEATGRRIKRQLLMGLALVFALGSIFAGVIQAGRAIEMGLAALAGGCVLLALRIAVSRPPVSRR